MMTSISLGILDQCPVRYGKTAEQALIESVKLAKFCEKLGYSRYWVAEHHNSTTFASATPEILIAQIAANTKKIYVGSGGVMILNYSALKVAEQFLLLNTFYPERIELGVGKARGTDNLGAQALSYPRTLIDKEAFEEQICDLLGYLRNDLSPAHQFAKLIVQPGFTRKNPGINIWLLGASVESAKFAARMGLKFSFAHFLNGKKEDLVAPTKIYKETFVPSNFLKSPEVSIAIEALCAPSQRAIQRITSSRNLEKALNHLDKNEFQGLLSPTDAIKHLKRNELQDSLNYYNQWYIDGTPDKIKEKISQIASYYEAEHVLLLTNCYSFKTRKKSYELIAKAFSLKPNG